MLKITNTSTATEQKWILHGRLSGPWVAELKSNWEKLNVESHGRRRVVDLTGVTFVDECGELVLSEMRSEGAQFVARGVDTRQMLADLENKTKRSVRKCLEHLDRGQNF
jgi:anti-anti-sigma regulatory factor